ncbi:MAG: hypothetical protein LBV74_17540 [Tannerella sp.]|jgi:hypothetical protein|nr:hypothetical protein [Tannerella sp.]
MKKTAILFFAFAIFIISGCNEIEQDEQTEQTEQQPDEADNTGDNNQMYAVLWKDLIGTKWKLYSIDHNTRGRTYLEPKDCETCYTLSFDKGKIGWTLSGVSIKNTINIKLYDPEFPNIVISVTEKDESPDGNLYCSIIKNVHTISSTGRLLYLNFNDCDGDVACNGTMIFARVSPTLE